MPARASDARATLDWSHSLLDTDEQATLRRLSVFAGSFRLDLAQRVASSGALDEWTVLDALTALIEKSLVHVRAQRASALIGCWKRPGSTPRRSCASTRRRTHAGASQRGIGGTRRRIQRGLLGACRQAVAQPLCADYDDLQAAFDRACATLGVPAVAASTGEALFNLDRMRGLVSPLRKRAALAHGLLALGDARTQARLWNCIARFLASTADLPLVVTAPERVAAWGASATSDQVTWRSARFPCAVFARGDWAGAERALDEAHCARKPKRFPRRLLAELAG
jgi:hypothetical protein